MGPSFEEKSVWTQLLATGTGFAAYFAVAGVMIGQGVTELPAYAALFTVAVVLIVVLMIVGHVIAAISGRVEGRDERDRLISWRAESNSAWLLAVGVLAAVIGMVFAVDNVWIAHLLLISLFSSEMLGFVLRIVYYRRGL